MLIRTDPFREIDRLAQQLFGIDGTVGTTARPVMMPMDAWQDGDSVHVEVDLPGLSPDAIDLDIDGNVLTVRAERPITEHADSGVEHLASERPRGVLSRQLVLGDNLDTQQISAHYEAGVLTLDIPIAEEGKSRRVAITDHSSDQQAVTT